MACEICGRNSCCKSFHSIEEQDAFDDIAEKALSNIQKELKNKLSRLIGHYHGNNYYVKLDDISSIIDDIY